MRRLGEPVIRQRYGNLFEMYERITGEDPYQQPMRIYPAIHYVMGGLWVDYNLMSNVDGLHVLGEANFSDHGANRLGASALMQGLADGYFIIPYTVGDYLARVSPKDRPSTDHPAFQQAEHEVVARVRKLLSVNGARTVDSFHRELGHVLWEHCGMARNEKGLKLLLERIPGLREEFWQNVRVPGEAQDFNQALEHAGRVADFLEFAELIAYDALMREESCGCHLREEHQTPEGEALRDDEHFSYVAAWEYTGVGKTPLLHQEPLAFESIHLAQRSYK
jgi:succinate dehydrogenase / fumarate reductase flavoprotein subunit